MGADPLVGDGAGILIQIPDPLFREWAKETGVTCRRPASMRWRCASCRAKPRRAKSWSSKFEHFIKVEGQKLLGWRDVPTDPAGLGKTVLDGMPLIRQAIIAAGPHIRDQDSVRAQAADHPQAGAESAGRAGQETRAAGDPAALHAQPFHPHRGL